jgi:outer membrane biosynthesis protein TonB
MARTSRTHARTAHHVAGTTGRTTPRRARRGLAVAGLVGLATLATTAPVLANQPFPGPGEIGLPPVGVTVSGPAQVDEAAGVAFYTIALTGTPAGTITVGYTTAEGSALAGADYGSTAGSVWLDDTTPTVIAVPIVGDDVDEPGEQFGFGISVQGGDADVVGSGVVVTSIVDDDIPAGPGDIALPEPQPEPGPGDIANPEPEPQPDPEPQPEPGDVVLPDPQPEPEPKPLPEGPDEIAQPEIEPDPHPQPDPLPEGPDDLAIPEPDPGIDGPDDFTAPDTTPDTTPDDGTDDTTPADDAAETDDADTGDDTHEVAGAQAVDQPSSLAFTGAGGLSLAGIGAALTGLGAAAQLAVRRRRQA